MKSFKQYCELQENTEQPESAEEKNRLAALLIKKQMKKIEKSNSGGGLSSGNSVADAYILSDVMRGLGEILVALLSGGNN